MFDAWGTGAGGSAMKPLIPCHCHRCGYEGEPQLVYAGPHIRMNCGKCHAYQKFIDKGAIPDLREIKLAIWEATNQDLQSIDEIKHEVGFIKTTSTLDQKVQYYKLLTLISRVLHNTEK